MVLSGALNHVVTAIVFGMVAFSGSAMFAHTSLLSLKYSRLKTLAISYSYIIPLGWLGAILASPLSSMQIRHQSLLTAVLLLGTALQLLPWKIFDKIKRLYQPSQILGTVLAVMLLHGAQSGIWRHISWHINALTLRGTAIAVGTGFLVTAVVWLAGLFFRMDWQSSTTQIVWGLGGFAMLCMVALNIVGVKIPPFVLLAGEGVVLSMGLGIPTFMRWLMRIF